MLLTLNRLDKDSFAVGSGSSRESAVQVRLANASQTKAGQRQAKLAQPRQHSEEVIGSVSSRESAVQERLANAKQRSTNAGYRLAKG